MRLMSRIAGRIAGVVCLASLVLSPAFAGSIEMIDPGQIPSKDAQPAAQQQQTPPKTETCIVDEGGFRSGKDPNFTIALRNTCETRVRCKVSAYVVTSFGPKQGQVTLILEPKSKGGGAYKEWSLKLRQGSGMANASRSCVDI